MNKALVEMLADGEFHSGEALGRKLGLSRAAIWKQIQLLNDLGMDVQSVRGRGYSVAGGIELLDRRVIEDLFTAHDININVLAEMAVSSTNDIAMRLVRENPSKPVVVIAEQQTAGRGRRGRQWQSPFGRNLYLTMGYPFNSGAAALEGLSLVVGLSVVRVLSRVFPQLPLGLKWPNDIWVADRKMGGVLIELAGDLDSACSAIIGVGLNLAPIPKQLAKDIDQPWTDLMSEQGNPFSRNELVAAIAVQLYKDCCVFSESGFQNFISDWGKYDALSERQVRLTVGDHTVEGVCLGVSRRGALCLNVDGQVQEFHGGEASLRPL